MKVIRKASSGGASVVDELEPGDIFEFVEDLPELAGLWISSGELEDLTMRCTSLENGQIVAFCRDLEVREVRGSFVEE